MGGIPNFFRSKLQIPPINHFRSVHRSQLSCFGQPWEPNNCIVSHPSERTTDEDGKRRHLTKYYHHDDYSCGSLLVWLICIMHHSERFATSQNRLDPASRTRHEILHFYVLHTLSGILEVLWNTHCPCGFRLLIHQRWIFIHPLGPGKRQIRKGKGHIVNSEREMIDHLDSYTATKTRNCHPHNGQKKIIRVRIQSSLPANM